MASKQETLGLIEVIGFPAAVAAADTALKAANVHLMAVTRVGGGIMTVQLSGDVGAITAAVNAGAETAKKLGELRARHVIPRLSVQVQQAIGEYTESQTEEETEEITDVGVEDHSYLDTVQNEEIEQMKKLSNQQLRRIAVGLVSSQEESAPMKYWNKNNLIQFILDKKKKEMPDGTER